MKNANYLMRKPASLHIPSKVVYIFCKEPLENRKTLLKTVNRDMKDTFHQVA